VDIEDQAIRGAVGILDFEQRRPGFRRERLRGCPAIDGEKAGSSEDEGPTPDPGLELTHSQVKESFESLQHL